MGASNFDFSSDAPLPRVCKHCAWWDKHATPSGSVTLRRRHGGEPGPVYSLGRDGGREVIAAFLFVAVVAAVVGAAGALLWVVPRG